MSYPLSFPVRAKSNRPIPDWAVFPDLSIVILKRQSDRKLPTRDRHFGIEVPTHIREKILWQILSDQFMARGDFTKIKIEPWSAALRRLNRVNNRIGPYIVTDEARRVEVIYEAAFPLEIEMEDRPPLELVAKPAIEDRRRTNIRFTPSRALVGFWERGLQSHISEFTPESFFDKIKGLLGRTDYQSTAEAFARKFTRMVSVLANRQRHQIHDYREFSENGRFSVAVQHQLLDRFPIVPDEATQFFSLLHDELVGYLGAGGALQGRWGKLTLKGNGLTLRNEKREISEPAVKWKAANIIE